MKAKKRKKRGMICELHLAPAHDIYGNCEYCLGIAEPIFKRKAPEKNPNAISFDKWQKYIEENYELAD